MAQGALVRALLELGAADLAADLPPGGPLDRGEALQQGAAKVTAELPGAHELHLAGLEAHPEAVHRAQLQLPEAFHDVGHALAGPAVAAEGAGQLALVGGGEHAGGQVPDGLEGLTHDGGGAEEDAVGEQQLLGHLAGVGHHHVIGAHVDLPALGDALADGLGQLPGVAVGADVGDDDGGPGVGVDHGAPLLIGVQHPGDVGVQHGAVARADHVQLQLPHPAQGLGHEGLVGADDVVEVVLGGPEIPVVVGDLAHQHLVHGVVAAEGVAGDQGPVLPDVGVHGVGPVEVGHHQELQRLVVQLQGHAVGDGHGVEVPVDDLLQKVDGTAGGHDLDPGVQLQQPLDAAAVVGLGVADHQVVHRLDGGYLLDLLQPAVQALGLGRLKEDGVAGRLEHIGVVGGAELGVHDDVKYPQLVVQGPGEVEAGLQREGVHGVHPFCWRILLNENDSYV